MEDQLEVQVLSDGSVRTTVAGEVSMVNHGRAEDFLKFLAQLLGGETEKHKLKHGHAHAHEHEHHKVKVTHDH